MDQIDRIKEIAKFARGEAFQKHIQMGTPVTGAAYVKALAQLVPNEGAFDILPAPDRGWAKAFWKWARKK